jgi:hypothetical protein
LLPRNRRKDDLVIFYAKALLNDQVVNIRYVAADLICKLYQNYSCPLSFYDILEERYEKETEEDVKQAIDEALNVAK